MFRVIAAVLLASVPAAAKPPQCVPSTRHISIAASGGKAIACWDDSGDCLALDDHKTVSRPAPAKPAAEVRDDQVCSDKTCKPAGKNLAASLATVRAAYASRDKDDDAQLDISATTDLAMVAIHFKSTVELWNVAKDKQLTPKVPATYPKGENPGIVNVDAVGKLAFATWSDCAGPCSQQIAVDADGANHSKAVEAGTTIALGDGYVVAGENGTVTVLDHSGHHTGAVDTKLTFPIAIAVASDDVVVLATFPLPADGQSELDFVHVKIKNGKPAIGTKGSVNECL